MNKEQQELLNDAYENYSKEYEKDNSIGMCLLVKRLDGKSTYRKPNKEMFVDLCTYDKTFSEKWGLKIEERELSLEERAKWLEDNKGYDLLVGNLDHDHIREVVEEESPTKLITLTYNDKTIESYE
jgi:hypothetical protein